MTRLAAFAFLLVSVSSTVWAQDAAMKADAASAAGSPSEPVGGILSLLPQDETTDHVLATPGGDLPYSATAGTIPLRGQDGRITARIFYTAYVAKDGAKDRPLTFAFNGGPGAASAYLHLGLMGPKLLDFGSSGDNGETPELRANPESWLRFTDLVFIDPVGTGWSRAASEDSAKGFYGVQQDAESLAKFITLYVQQQDRLPSPKYLVGESYGGFRAAKVASALKNSQGILVSGIAMISPFLDGRFLGNTEDPITAALQLPSLGAAKLEREGAFSPDKLAEIERFAMSDYLVGLAGPSLSGTEADEFYNRVSAISGVPADAVQRVRGFIGDIFTKQTVEDGRIVSPYDSAYSVVDAYPEASYGRNDDPILDGYTRAYGAAFFSYARHELQFRTEMTYTLLNEEANRRWEWNGGRGGDGRTLASADTDLRDLLSVIPGLHLLIAHGYSDALTPYGVSRYVIDHLPTRLTSNRVMLKNYVGGHMFYTRPGSKVSFAADAEAFYRTSRGDGR